jgi:TonB family protein
MKKLLFALCFLSSNCLASTTNICTPDEVIQFSNRAISEIVSKTYYPPKAQMKGIEGEGSVILVFDTAWNIIGKEILKSTGSEHLDIAMTNTIKNSNFSKPNCIPELPVRITVPFIFKLNHGENKSPALSEAAE